MPTAEPDAYLAEEKYATVTVKRVKAELKAEGKIEYGHTGFGNETKYYTKLIQDEKQETEIKKPAHSDRENGYSIHLSLSLNPLILITL